MSLRHELKTGDLVLASVAGETFTLEFYGWWDYQRSICKLVAPENGTTLLSHFDQIICKLGQGTKVLKTNNDYFKRKANRK